MLIHKDSRTSDRSPPTQEVFCLVDDSGLLELLEASGAFCVFMVSVPRLGFGFWALWG